MFIVFDLETTGLPQRKYVHPYKTTNFNTSRMIEIGYMIVNEITGETVKEVSRLVQHESKIGINNSHIHGITEEMVDDEGVKIHDVFDELYYDLKTVDTLVSHNMDFDLTILLSEVYRRYPMYVHLLAELYSKTLCCTVQMGKALMPNGKYPKLIELHQKLFDEEWVQPHRALEDAKVCAKCYLKLIKKDKK